MNKGMAGGLHRLICIAVLSFASAGAQASLQEGIDAFQNGNHRAALEKFTPLANQGDSVAELYMAKIYMQGHDAQPDYTKAMSWARKAANHKNTDAEYFIGFLHYYGLGTPQGYPEAMARYRKAADMGNIKAQSNLGMMFVNGLGAQADLVQAYKWLKLAELAGMQEAGSKLRAVEEQMTAQQITEGKALVQKWKPQTEAESQAKSKPKSKSKHK